MKKHDYATFGGNVSRVPARSAGRARILPAAAFALLSLCAGAAEKIVGPEMWYCWLGGNVAKPGITREMEEIAKAGVSGIHMMHCEIKGDTVPWTNICPVQVHCMDANWNDAMSFLGDECRRVGLKLTVQNCPGWSQSGGPWVPIEHAQRDIAAAVSLVRGGGRFALPPIPKANASRCRRRRLPWGSAARRTVRRP